MKKYQIIIIALSFLMISTAMHAKMYSWVDENGVRHFSDTPPAQNEVEQDQVEHYATSQYQFNHRLYRKDGDNEYCGDRRLPWNEGADPKNQYLNVLANLKSARKLKASAEKRYEDLRMREIEANSNPKVTANYSGAMEKALLQIETYDCMLEWSQNKIETLADAKQQIVQESNQAEYEFEEIQRLCGEEPPPGIHSDEKAINWYKCKKRVRKERNERLKRMKSAKAYERSLKDIMESD